MNHHHDVSTSRLDRRKLMRRWLAALSASALPSVSGGAQTDPAGRTGMGLVIYDCSIRRRWMQRQKSDFDLFHPLTFLRHCRELGAGGMQAALGTMEPDQVRPLRQYAQRHDLFIDAIVRPPQDQRDLERFEAEIRTARDVGVQAARTTIIPGRRYERFQRLEEFQQFQRRGRRMLERAVPVVEKYGVHLAVENHKDQRIDERVALLRHLDSEFVGACLDTGNSFALLDGAYQPIESLAPFARTVHLKDQALREYDDGFLLGDIPLGQGSFDLKRMVATIRKARPDVRFALELITRDPLKVPCLTPEFFATMPDTPAADLAATMQFVRRNTARQLQQVSQLTIQQQVELEDANVAASIQYARTELRL